MRVVLDDLGLSLPHEHVRAPIRAHVERLVACVQDENLMHGTRGYLYERFACLLAHRAAALGYRPIALSTAVCSSGESATEAVPRSTSLT